MNEAGDAVAGRHVGENLSGYLDGELNDREIGELLEWVAVDPVNADLFARQCLLDQHTYELLQDGLVPPTSDRPSVERRARLPMCLPPTPM